ncbi:G-type lectin S-receptor-like serine/threonine-protein kinase At5g24080 [Carica papaya]|uniref:G-type lectin S-receptor-like serine/threonine-protein kinase At5g24080 n=1 Tax=Carica papaya TaxID=3649 RepID=UPI000B8CB868|nr:G-type lectin S-receptor-like serine/threonine-protein kinase At5g24080 [Carica papaya]
MSPCYSLPFLFLLLLSNSSPSSAQNPSSYSFSDPPWRPSQNKNLISPNSVFAAGFLPLRNSKDLYTFSIWVHNISETTEVWSLNDDSPVTADASLDITAGGELRLVNSSGQNLWQPPAAATNSTKLQLNDNGNLVYGTWESFHHPTHTFLPNQTMNGTELVSKNGKFMFLDCQDLVFNSSKYWSSSDKFQKLGSDGKVALENGKTVLSADYGSDNLRLRRVTLDVDGNFRIYSLDPSVGKWEVVWRATQEICSIHGTCGPNAICMSDPTNDSVSCVCPPGFKRSPADPKACDRKIQLTNNTRFVRLDYVNYTSDSSRQRVINAQNFTICESKCLADPRCLGFGFKYDGTGYCVLQLDQLLFGYWSPGTDTAMFLRVDKSETDQTTFTGMTELMETTCPVRISLPIPPEESNTTTRNIVIICILFAAELITGVVFFWAFLKRYIKYRDMARTLGLEFLPAGGPKRFSYAELKAATNDFSNLIGRGGFGDVYKGELSDHRAVAVKCLKDVTGGDTEFWAEVNIIARMHHLNLVRLWGFCAEKGQRILVYEYVSNGSLDKYLFHARRDKPSNKSEADTSSEWEGEMDPVEINNPKPMLDWSIRYRIALGVARAIAYLHEECLEWVLHCDIKPENILLGDDFCPKISDFGLAKLKKKEDMVSMSRIRGTRGYMAPEWIKMDPITPKADVYSFGMVLLEIVSGVRNFEIQSSLMDSEDWYFPRWAFDKVFKESNVEDILDRQIKHCYDSRAHFDLVDRMVKTAMWCLQDRPEMRPSMGKVAKMLEGTVEITEPKKPTIFFLSDE